MEQTNAQKTDAIQMVVGEDGILKFSYLPKVMKEFRKPLPKAAEQRSEGSKTQKGYDTAGYGYAWISERFNDVVGFCWRIVESEPKISTNQSKSGNTMHVVQVDVVVQLGNWKSELIKEELTHVEDGIMQKRVVGVRMEKVFEVLAETPVGNGWHKALNIADALKGAKTNGFKKAAGFFGIGNEAYKKMIDDENKPNKVERSSPVRRVEQSGSPVNVPGPTANLKKIKDILAERGVTNDQEAIEHLNMLGFQTKTMSLSEKQEKMVLALLLQSNNKNNDGNNQTGLI